jgi:glutathione S-transferase
MCGWPCGGAQRHVGLALRQVGKLVARVDLEPELRVCIAQRAQRRHQQPVEQRVGCADAHQAADRGLARVRRRTCAFELGLDALGVFGQALAKLGGAVALARALEQPLPERLLGALHGAKHGGCIDASELRRGREVAAAHQRQQQRELGGADVALHGPLHGCIHRLRIVLFSMHARNHRFSAPPTHTKTHAMHPRLTLVSHVLCPYVQRAAIVLAEKHMPFTRRDVDLANKPDWFNAISPLGKTPVLLVGDTPIFESAVICEYLDDTLPPRLHPAAALQRARHRAWMEFGSAVLNGIGAFYNARDEAALQARRDELVQRFATLEGALGDGPWFDGARFSIVDAVFGPVFRYFDTFERIGDFGFFDATPKVSAWRARLATRDSVRDAVAADYDERLLQFLRRRGSALSARIAQAPVSA